MAQHRPSDTRDYTLQTILSLSSKLVVAEYEGSRYSVGLSSPTDDNLNKEDGEDGEDGEPTKVSVKVRDIVS